MLVKKVEATFLDISNCEKSIEILYKSVNKYYLFALNFIGHSLVAI